MTVISEIKLEKATFIFFFYNKDIWFKMELFFKILISAIFYRASVRKS